MKHLVTLFIIIILASCEQQGQKADAYGNFEATEIILSAEGNGKIKALTLEEGQTLHAGQLVGYIDTIQLHLKKEQLQASIATISSKILNEYEQVDVLLEQKKNILREKKRFENLIKDGAATQKQLDDISGEALLIEKRIVALKDNIQTQNKGILSEVLPIRKQIEQINDQIQKSYLTNPIKGTVLNKYAEQEEIATFGKPLYKISNLDNIFLKAYISGNQLAQIKLNQQVSVVTDRETGNKFQGNISWISEKAEFTPKIIQTKEERVNLVYAIKVAVKNNGTLKIGMPAEVWFN